jgi:hypothetical protein
MASAAALAGLTGRLGGAVHLGWPVEGRAESVLATGDPAFDAKLGGVPRGRITELVGPPSAGKTTLLLGLLARTASSLGGCGEPVALVDPTRSVFPPGAWARGRLLVVRPRTIEEALKALDLLLVSASLAVIGLHLAATRGRGIPEAARVRTARLARETGTAVIACATAATFGTYAALRVELAPSRDGAVRADVTKNRSGFLGGIVLTQRLGEPFRAPGGMNPAPTALRRAG